jgi:hypothetical protein
MNAIATPAIVRSFETPRGPSAKELFRQRFQRSLRSCLRKGFCVEESFGMIWMETWEEVPLPEAEREKLYDEMIIWAKHGLR